MKKKSVGLIVTFFLLKVFATNTTANESITPFLIYYQGDEDLSARAISIFTEYDLLVLKRNIYDKFNGDTWGAIKARSPGTKIFLYQNGAQIADNTDNYAVRALNNLGRYNVSRGSDQGSINKDHPDWFLKNSEGQRLKSSLSSHFFELDFGNKSFADYWSKHTLEDIAFQEWRADGVFIDHVALCSDTLIKYKSHKVPAKYSNCQSWNKNMSDFIVRVSTALQRNSQRVMVNLGNSHRDSGPKAWRELSQRNSAPDIMVEEGAFAAAWGDKGVVLYWHLKNWQEQIDLPSSVNRPVAMISSTDLAPGQKGVSWTGEAVSHSQIMRFSVGSYLLARNTNGPTTYFTFNDNQQQSVFAKYNTLRPRGYYDNFDIGTPVAKYEKKLPGQDVFFRKYSNGYVYVNPSSNKIVAIKAESDAEFSEEYNNARKDGVDWYFDLKPHDAAIVKKSAVSNSKPSKSPPLAPELNTQ